MQWLLWRAHLRFFNIHVAEISFLVSARSMFRLCGYFLCLTGRGALRVFF